MADQQEREVPLSVKLARIAHGHVEGGKMRHDVGLALAAAVESHLSSSQQVMEEALETAINACNAERLIDATGEASDIAYGYAIDHCINAIKRLKSPSPTPAPEQPKCEKCGLPESFSIHKMQGAHKFTPSPSSVAMTDADIDKWLDDILHAGGTAFKHYTMPKSINDMRAALRNAINSALQSSPTASSTGTETGLIEKVYKVTFGDGSSCHFGSKSIAMAYARQTGTIEEIALTGQPELYLCATLSSTQEASKQEEENKILEGFCEDMRKRLDAVFDFFGIGEHARSMPVLMQNLQNLDRREKCLSAIEREFFHVPIEPEEDEEGDPGTECMMSWGASPEEYVRQFREALACISASPSTSDADKRDALKVIKGLVSGDKLPHWSNDQATYVTRGKIADICDAAMRGEKLLKIVKFSASDGNAFYAEYVSFDGIRETVQRMGNCVQVDLLEMTQAEYKAIPATNQSHELFDAAIARMRDGREKP